MTRAGAVLLCTFALGGCVSDQANRYYAAERYPPRPKDQVAILWKTPDKPYDVIADLQARRASPNYMRREAAKIGADAVIVSLLGGYRARGDRWAGEDTHAKTYSRITGTAIRYRASPSKK